MNVSPVITRLEEWIGLKPDSVGPNVLATAVRNRMQALGVTDAFAYLARLTDQAAELDTLIADVVVPETWFFRGGDLFAYLAEHIRQASLAQPVRVLCVPCSTGEEPYSLAIALLEAGVPAQCWTLEGVDLCRRSLDEARRGCYRELSFRQIDADRRGRYFRQTADAWEIDERLRGAVSFRQGNVVDPDFLAGERPYQMILCRNLFIYLHPVAREQVMAHLDRLLVPGGILCVGHAEPVDGKDLRFQRTGPDGFFLYRRATSDELLARPSALPPRPERLALSARTPREPEPPPPAVTYVELVANPQPAPRPEEPLLDKARRQADTGQLEEALASCRAYLARTGPTPSVYTLMGVVHQARQESDEAERSFQKALYLQPDHAEAILHLLLLSEQRGNRSQADRLRRRLERLSPRGDS